MPGRLKEGIAAGIYTEEAENVGDIGRSPTDIPAIFVF